jgi:hypothetical protein
VSRIKNFLLGLMIGLCLASGLYFLRSSDTRLRIDIGRILDQDIVYLKDGSLVRGWVVKESESELLIETEKATFTLPASICKNIEKDVFLKFVRKAI